MKRNRTAFAATVVLTFSFFFLFSDPANSTIIYLAESINSIVSPAHFRAESLYFSELAEASFREPGHRIYKAFFVDHWKFIYPPSSLFLFDGLLATSSIRVSMICLQLLSIVLIALCNMSLFRRFKGKLKAVDALSVLVLGLLFLPIAYALLLGQFQLFMDAVWAVSVVLWFTERRGWAGFLVGLNCAIKPQMALFLIWAVWRREWRFSSALAATVCITQLASLLCFGWTNNLEYLQVLSYIGHRGEAFFPNQSMNGLLNRLFGNGDASIWNPHIYPPYSREVFYLSTICTLVILAAGILIPQWKGWSGTTPDFLFFGGTTVLASPIAWEHHYGYFIMIIVYLLAKSDELGKTRFAFLVAATVAMSNRLSMLDRIPSGTALSLLNSYIFYSGVALLILLGTISSRRKRLLADQEIGSLDQPPVLSSQ